MPNRPNFGCPEAEPLLAVYLDGTLEAATAALLEAHLADCPACAEELRLVRQGKEWLGILRLEDAEAGVPSGLTERILAATRAASGAAPVSRGASPQAAIRPAPWANVNMAAVRSGMTRTGLFDARLMMTAAMAFFSITLTMNVAGIRLNDLKPSNLRHTVVRTYADTNAHVTRYYENMRVVYELESRVRELRRAAEATDTNRNSRPSYPVQRKSQTSSPQGHLQTSPQSNSRRESAPIRDGVARKNTAPQKKAEPEPAPVAGELMEASLQGDGTGKQTREDEGQRSLA